MFSGLRFYSRVLTRTIFRIQVFQGPGFSGSRSRVRVQVLEVVQKIISQIFQTLAHDVT